MIMSGKRRRDMAPQESLLLIADSGPGIGWGHLSRMLALGQAWTRHSGRASLWAGTIPAWVQSRAAESGIACWSPPAGSEGLLQVADLEDRLLAEKPSRICLDGYRFDDALERRLRRHCRFLAAFDDFGHACHAAADLVVNANVYGTDVVANLPVQKLMAGPRFVMLRQEFLDLLPGPQTIPGSANGLRFDADVQANELCPSRDRLAVANAVGSDGNRLTSSPGILVSLGGGSTSEVVHQVVEGLILAKLPCRTRIEFVGHRPDSTRSAWARLEAAGYASVWRDHDVSMPAVFKAATMAIAASGSTLNELAFLKVPSIAFALAPNQAAVGMGYARRSACLWVDSPWQYESSAAATDGDHASQISFPARLAAAIQKLWSSQEFREQIGRQASALIDGRGPERICRRLDWGNLRLRPAQWADWPALLALRNDEQVLRNSLTTDRVQTAAHQEWFRARLEDSDCLMWVVCGESDRFLGQARIQIRRSARTGTVSLSLIEPARGCGVSEFVLNAMSEVGRRHGLSTLEAEIKRENFASLRAFHKAGFREMGGPEKGPGTPIAHLELRLEGHIHPRRLSTASNPAMCTVPATQKANQ